VDATTDARSRRSGVPARSAPPRRRPPRRRRPSARPVVVGALALFLAVLALLAVQMRLGGDPALGAGTTPARPRPRHVLVHRVVRRVVVVRVPAAAAPAAPAPATSAPAAAPPPPAAVAPAPAPAPPPPAPVVTRAS
jgi:hypothetical protein